ncbi:MAG: DNA-directed RNA polymerase subunit beta' [Candidatus Sungbacteria bacterium]|nr:DNA-directed RNA polymerase subunit beta' [Candidatus Sungbacteria bacterium]
MESTKSQDFNGITIQLASPEDILEWSKGEITKPETINYRTAKPEKDGLFDERIFGPTKDYECYCGKYRRVRYKGIICDKCGVEVTRAVVRRERMGHIKLAAAVSHIWFLRGVPSKIGLLLDLSVADLERVIYFAGYVITKVNDDAKDKVLEAIEKEFRVKTNKAEKAEVEKLKTAKETAKEELRSITPLKVLSEVEYHRLSLKYGDVFEADIGAEALRRLLERMDLRETVKKLDDELKESLPAQQRKILKRLKVINGMIRAGVRPEWMFLTVLPVIPPDLRPVVALDGGRYATSDLNDLYRRVINRNNRLKRLYELKAPEVITRNEKRMLQEAVDALIDNSVRRGQAPAAAQAQRRPLKSLADMLKGKQGRFRQNLLGKRVDYSGRSVIVVGPHLKLHQCGLPKEMALELFKPFVLRKIIDRELAHNIRGAGRLLEERPPEVWALLEEVIAEEERFVLLNRAPTLHRLGIQAFQPVLIEGFAIQIHPMVCPPFNADFDGDQMAVHLPLTDEAQREARELMLAPANLLKPATGEPIIMADKDMVLGVYWATFIEKGLKGEGKIFPDPESAVFAESIDEIDLRAGVTVRLSPREGEKPALVPTSVGRILFNRVLPSEYPFVNKELTKKDLEEVISDIIRRYGFSRAAEILDAVKRFGFARATLSAMSWGMGDLSIPAEKPALIEEGERAVSLIQQQYLRGLLTDKERYERVVEIWRGVMEKIKDALPKTLDSMGPVYSMITSRARGSWFQIMQMSGMKGLVINPAGKTIELPVVSSYKEGLSVLEYFISTHGARKGTADTALKTAVAGYLTRRLVDVSQDITIVEEDCRTKNGIPVWREDSVEVGRPLQHRLYSRFMAEDAKDKNGAVVAKKGEFIDRERALLLANADVDVVWVRSPITCRNLRGLCQKCYGLDLGRNELVKAGEAVGIVAAQSIGEPGTQLTMRTFHTGGVAGGGDITTGLPRVEEIFEVRPPKGKAVISEIDGTVIEIEDVNHEKIIKIAGEPDAAPRIARRIGKLRKLIGKQKRELADDGVREFHIPPSVGIFVELGSKVKKGDLLSEGHADLKELFRIAGKTFTQRYIIKEVQKIYSLQGAPIHDKHTEVIVRQMFSRVKIKNGGDTTFTPGEVIDKLQFHRENRRIEKLGQRPATAYQILLGITRVALSTSSFLSAASFQETARVLINAAVEGKRDPLRGLKENVIIGRLIPAGTGLKGLAHERKP